MLPPDNLKDLDKFMQFQQQLVLECAVKKKEIDLIDGNVQVISKTLILYINIDDIWTVLEIHIVF